MQTAPTSDTLSGVVSRIFFANPESPWMAGKLRTDEGPEVSFSGKVVAEAGDRLTLSGSWVNHEKYGRQFEAETGVVKMDESPDALAHLLATDGRFAGLGPVRAKAVVEAALRLSPDGELSSSLLANAEEIAARSGAPLAAVQLAGETWGARRGYFDALALLVDQGWSGAQAQKIVAKLGENAPAIVQSDPYLLIGKIARFGFKTVDLIARKLGVKSTDPGRLAAGVAYVLDRTSENGHTWTTRDDVLHEARQELRPDTLDGDVAIADALDRLIEEKVVHVDKSPEGEEIVADARLAKIEFDVFAKLVEGLTSPAGDQDYRPDGVDLDGARAQIAFEMLNEDQALAVQGFSNRRFVVISGGAGVGKTFTMKAVCEIAEENSMVVELCAPTGKAARKLTHATGREARTIHRLLEPMFDESTGRFSFGKNKGNPVQADLVVVDEVSMVDVRLMYSLLSALPPECRLLLVGDHHQIPSVGPGAILRDILSAQNHLPDAVHVLSKVVRQAGVLARNTSALLDGVVDPNSSPAWGIQSTEKGHEEAAAAICAQLVEVLVTAENPEPFGCDLDFAWDVQVLAPMRKGPLGTYALNTHLQALRQRLLGNVPPERPAPNKPPKPVVGDRVIWTKNDYVLNLMNGTQAIVLAIKKGGAMDLLVEDGREVTIPASKRNRIEVAYAMTIHKSQGSEWPCVVLVTSSTHYIMRDRNLLYTGASRAAKSLTILGDPYGIRSFARETKSDERRTFGAFLARGWNPTA